MQTWQKSWLKKKHKRHYGNSDTKRRSLLFQITSCFSDHAYVQEDKRNAGSSIASTRRYWVKMVERDVNGGAIQERRACVRRASFHKLCTQELYLEFTEELIKTIQYQRQRALK